MNWRTQLKKLLTWWCGKWGVLWWTFVVRWRTYWFCNYRAFLEHFNTHACQMIDFLQDQVSFDDNLSLNTFYVNEDAVWSRRDAINWWNVSLYFMTARYRSSHLMTDILQPVFRSTIGYEHSCEEHDVITLNSPCNPVPSTGFESPEYTTCVCTRTGRHSSR